MIVLGIDTATPQVGCAIGGWEGTLASFHAARGRRHAETLVPAIELVCRYAAVELSQVRAIAVDTGPGLFTGLRVGIATAKALASALGIPMVGLCSLDLLAYPERRTGRLVAAVVDARRSEVFWSLYRQVPGGIVRVTEPSVSSPEELACELMAAREECLAVGDGALRYSEVLREVGHVEVGNAANAYPCASVLVELAHPMAVREETLRPESVRPLYLRSADVRINWEERDRRVVEDR
jgi:tRNA threonylcarbamoyladenosine biosynthesis protein TsaB